MAKVKVPTPLEGNAIVRGMSLNIIHYEMLDKLMKNKGLSRSDVVRRAIEEYYKKEILNG